MRRVGEENRRGKGEYRGGGEKGKRRDWMRGRVLEGIRKTRGRLRFRFRH